MLPSVINEDPFEILPPSYREKAVLGPTDLKSLFDIGRREYDRLQVRPDFPKPLNLRTRGPRWSTLAIAKWLQAESNATEPQQEQ